MSCIVICRKGIEREEFEKGPVSDEFLIRVRKQDIRSIVDDINMPEKADTLRKCLFDQRLRVLKRLDKRDKRKIARERNIHAFCNAS